MQTITPFLWFNGNIEEALHFYTSIFKTTKIINTSKAGGQNGKIFSATFELQGQKFHALDGGPKFKFTEAISFFVSVDTQEEVDELWEKLSEGGEKSRCGWLKDKFGLSWQIIPKALGELMSNKDPIKSKKVMEAMLKMDKIVITDLQNAHDSI